jgi:hypothetical protein
MYDFDSDGSLDADDCDPADPAVHPGALDPFGDLIDQDCDGYDGIDRDGDGYPSNAELQGALVYDCDDANSNVHPDAPDTVGDQIDANCDGHDGVDRDGDGAASLDSGGGDCDDEDEAVHPGAEDSWGDEIDQDCDGGDGIDEDGDGYPANEELAGQELYDCNDNNPEIHPGALEQPGDQVDQDCDGLDGFIAVEIAIGPGEPRTGDDLVVSVTTVAETWLVQWYLDDELQPDLEDDDSVPSVLTSEGQLWQVQVTPIASGNVLFGSRVSVTVVIQNTAPVLAGVGLQPENPTELLPLLAAANGLQDADPADTLQVRYRWFVNEVEVLGWSGAQLSGLWFDKGDDIRVDALPSDGTDEGVAASSPTVTAVNTPPEASSAGLFPSVIVEASTVSASLFGWTDPDPADAAQEAGVVWFVDGVTVAVGDELGGEHFDSGDTITAEVTPFDGEDWGPTLWTAPAVVANTPPSLLGVAILPVQPDETSVLSAELVGLSDPDLADVVSVQYAWTVNGLPASSNPTLDGASFGRSDLVGVEVTPYDAVDFGPTRTATPVSVNNSLPTLAEAVIVPAQPVETSVLTVSLVGLDDADPTDVVYVQYLWSVNGSLVGSGPSLDGDDFERGDLVELTVTPYDPLDFGAPVVAAPVTVGNSLPSVATVAIEPNPIFETSVLVAALTGVADPDPADVVQLQYEWLVNGVPVGSGASIDGSVFDRGDSVQLAVTPSDPVASGASVQSASVTVSNTPPVIASVHIEPAQPLETSVLSAQLVGLEDPDPGELVRLQYSWTVAGVPAGNNPTLDGSSFDRGDPVQVTVTPYDPVDFGAPVTSLAVTVINSAPSLDAVTISPDPADVTVPYLAATGLGFDDPDGDGDQTSFSWLVDGAAVATGSQLAPGNFAAGDVVEVVATPSDGLLQGATVSAQITIDNSSPSVLAVAVMPGGGSEETVFSVVGTGFSDPDGDAEDYLHQWYVNAQPSATTATLDGASFDRGDLVSVEITAWDGQSAGNTVASAPVSIVNTGPTLTTVTLSPAVAYTDTVITCAAGDPADLDGDTLSLTYTWVVDGLPVNAANAPTLDGGAERFTGQTWFDKGHEVACTVTVSDGAALPVSVTSASLVVANSAPTLEQADLIPASAYTFTQLSCLTSGYADADGDPSSYTWDWYIGGVLSFTSTTSNALAPSYISRGDTVWCIATASDGTAPAPPAQSGPLVISNTPPTAPVLAWSPVTPQVATALSCVVYTPASDLDGDTFVYHWRWYLDSVAQASLDDIDTVPAAQVQAGDRWSCQVWADDGTAGPIAEKAVYLFGAGISFPAIVEASDMVRLPHSSMMPSGYQNLNRLFEGRIRLIESLDDPPTGSWTLRSSSSTYFRNYDLTPQSCLSGLSRSGFSIGGVYSNGLVDLNGDGLKDKVSSHYSASGGGYSQSGRAWVWFQPASGFPSSGSWGTTQAHLTINGLEDQHRLSSGVVAGDANGDGYQDLLLSSGGSGGGGYLFYGPLPTGTYDADALGVLVSGTGQGEYYGHGVSGDFNGDGYDDFAMHYNSGSWMRLIYGRAGASPQPAITRSLCGPWDGRAVGDFDGDGYDDFVCRTNIDYRLYWGGPNGLGLHGTTTVDTRPTSPSTPPWSTAWPVLDDMDGDGAAELLVLMADDTGEHRKDGNFALFLGGSRPTATLTAADAAVVFSGDFQNDTDFEYCEIVPDLDGGGIKDIACYADDNYTYVHLVEDTDLDGDLFSVLDCDADDTDPSVH